MTKNILLRVTFVLFVTISILAASYLFLLNLDESLMQLNGKNTLTNQMLNLPRRELIFYSMSLTLAFFLAAIGQIVGLKRKNKIVVLVFSVLVWILAILEQFTDNIFRYQI